MSLLDVIGNTPLEPIRGARHLPQLEDRDAIGRTRTWYGQRMGHVSRRRPCKGLVAAPFDGTVTSEAVLRAPSSLILVLALVAPVPALAGALSGVTACDYKRLEAYYEMPRGQVKRQLRQGAHKSTVIDTPRGRMNEGVYWEVMSASKMPAKCAFSETSYTAADAEALAAAWGTDRVGAQAIVESKIAEGYEDGVTWALEQARGGGGDQSKVESPEGAALDAFWASDRYSYCDARMVATAWQSDVFDAKIGIGSKLKAKDGPALQALEQTLVGARHQAISRGETCQFWETDYSSEDAARLARAWGTSLESAKARVSDMVLRGQGQAVQDMLRRAP